ncbi:hypothetical protein P691DRAFT_767600 [Macrolepiota fuliginosa MF-IS2]|uniref:Uncharacterized protein n=1 Tax=Macrolepiota fuliginosa MF-IS2 TaxID=1400762 RepID=A0A9P6BUR2_9AGAR|nr:hypothetical protein P691DRAFT_767600 [Macrolepiota fuliginosa MF-IS2]
MPAGSVIAGVPTVTAVWYFRTYRQDPWSLKAFVSFVWAVDVANFISTVGWIYHALVLREVGQGQGHRACANWIINTQTILTELSCCLVELFFILRMWRFAEKKQWAIFAVCSSEARIKNLTDASAF